MLTTRQIPKRLSEIADALPLFEGMRVLEVGSGTGVTASGIASRFKNIYIRESTRLRKLFNNP